MARCRGFSLVITSRIHGERSCFFMIGNTVARRYRLLEVIGRGGYCVVYRAADLHLLDEVAVKLLHDAHLQDPGFIERMDREYLALDALRGTAAPAVYAFHRIDNDVFLVMELLRGRDLESHLVEAEAAAGLIDTERFVRYLSPVVDTLEVAHDIGIVHRDLKPGNIFVMDSEDAPSVRLLDFGLASLAKTRRITAPGMVIGSPSYIAPEMWQKSSTAADHRADVYSLGAIIFRLLTGQVPFPAESMLKKLEAATTAERPSLHALRPDLPPSIDEWARQALAVDPAERFSKVRAMWNAVLDALAAAPMKPAKARA
jgi:serine/threonine-protein kinase